ncbi:MAG: VanZ family protein [Methylobacter sp.]|nr:VanZ family protein [Methylobacter sp.]
MFFKWLLLIYLIILGFLSLNPWLLPDSKLAMGFIAWDLLDHAAAYGLLSVLMTIAFRQQCRPLMMTSIVILTSSLIGVLFEYGQYWFTSTRQFSFYDAVANVLGAVLGMAVLWFFLLYRKRWT